MLLWAAALGSSAAWASDIQCSTTQQAAERVICDHAILNNEYDDIFAQQQALLRDGRLAVAQLVQWRQARNACVDVHCVDGVFAQWKTMARSLEAVPQAAPIEMASDTAAAPVGPNPEAPPAPASQSETSSPASPTSEASLVHQGSAAGIALPQPVEASDATAPAPAVASAASAASDARRTTGMSAGLLLVLLVAVGAGVLFARRTRRGG
ncbi:hypothetical protein [Burkholderia sp. Ax-1724]|uniref:hypothetical protein n=1 Tax=Burkholderia sp. Ax-1724 TaxID=2608336 RepID=UPI0031F5655E